MPEHKKKKVERRKPGHPKKNPESTPENSFEDSHSFIKKELENVEIENTVHDDKEHPIESIDNEKPDARSIEKKLTEIYENSDGSMPDMKKINKKSQNKVLAAFFVLIFACILFAIVAWIGFFVIQPRTHFSEEDVIVSISGDTEVTIGKETTYHIRYRNAQNIALHDVVLELRYPKGFMYVSSTVEPQNDTHDVWNIGNMEPQASGSVEITGKLLGNIDSEQSIRAFFNYTPANFSSLFQRVAHIEIVANNSPIDFALSAPAEVPIGSQTNITATISSSEGQISGPIIVSCDTTYFSPNKESAEPAMDSEEPCQWTFDSLTQEQTVHMSGSFASASEETVPLILSVYGVDTSTSSTEKYMLATQTAQIHLIKTDLVFNIAINGGMSDMTVAPGEQLNASISIKNSGEIALKNVAVSMQWDAPSYRGQSMLAWNKFDTEYDVDIVGEQVNNEVRRGVITWDDRYIDGLAELMPGEEVRIDFTLPIKGGGDTTLSNFVANNIVASAQLKYLTGDEQKIIDSNSIDLKLISDVDIEVQDSIEFNEEGQTEHTVTWLVSNSYHSLKDITLTADIYGDVSVNEELFVVPAGEVSYDTEKKQMVWTIDEMPLSVDVLAFQFKIQIPKENPSQTQLTSDVRLKATDVQANEQILQVGDVIMLE